MQIAEQPRMRVGVAPGTTTFQLAGPQAVVCDADASRVAYQRMREYPPWKVTAARAFQRVRQVLDPYGTIESLKGLGETRWQGMVRPNADKATCVMDERPSRVNDYRAGETTAYGFQVTDDNPYGELAGPRVSRLGDAVVAPPAVPLDPASATLQTLQMHQDRMYLLGIISAAAVASTALVNVFRYSTERRETRKRGGHTHTRVAAEPAPSISGARRRRRR